VCQLLPDALATAFYAVLDLPTGDLAYANAGHPAALLDTGGGHAGYLDGAAGAMLGASADTDYTASHGSLPPGASLLLYTDGLIERRAASISDALAEFAATAVPVGPDADSYAARILAGAGSDTGDDACLVAVRIL
jgi:serine phosphatase RsbU (regulator of sigma subunit)